MLDIIFENFFNVIGIIILFILSNAAKEFIVDHLTEEEQYAKKITEYHNAAFNEKRKKLLFKGFFTCVLIGMIAAVVLGRAQCDEVDPVTQRCETYDEDSSFVPTDIQRVGNFTTFFSYTFLLVIISVSEGEKQHHKNIIDCERRIYFENV